MMDLDTRKGSLTQIWREFEMHFKQLCDSQNREANLSMQQIKDILKSDSHLINFIERPLKMMKNAFISC